MKGLLIFAAGLAVGAVAGAVIVKNKVLADAKAEIDEVREYYRESRGQKDEHVEEVKEVKEVEKKEYELKDILIKDEPKTEKEHTNYSQITKMYMSKDEYQTPMYDDPFVIDPSEFGENPEYDTETLTYFADGVLVDDVDDVIEEPDIVVGLENLKVFEEFGATSVYVRNDIYKTDYEIIRDDWNYSDLKEPVEPPVKEKKPHQL
ncbi:hypothetical protein [Methanobrevibacter sp.]|uniref:hypothetical protein n=1 Tax=Methanobrevibacter sp. TaxID=66852 RepID=UPI00386967C4